jgi:hypothetical protein
MSGCFFPHTEASLATFDIKEYARRGAEARAHELTQELAAIYRAFPGLRRGGSAASSGGTAVRRRKPMTAAQKREVSRRMKKYWAARRKANS